MIDESVPVSESVIFIANTYIGYWNIGYFAYWCTSSSNYIESVAKHWRKLSAIVSFMAPVCVPMLEKSSPWHSFTCLLDKQ